MRIFTILIIAVWCASLSAEAGDALTRPNIVLVMADDMGWGQTGYCGHPVLKTPNLDAMAANGLRFDRFYAGAPVCSPSRASVLTGRSNDRTGVRDHGYALRHQEKTLPQALREAGYATGHFGKWHLNGVRGPGVPVLATDIHNPGAHGFDEWLSSTNYFDRNPILGTPNGFADFEGDSSEVIVAEALGFIERAGKAGKPSFTAIWYGSPHHPARAADEDKAAFDNSLDNLSKNHHGELVAMDRSIGTLRRRLDELELAHNTLVWFCSDNGGLKDIEPDTTGGLRDFKGSLYEGGLRVPAIIEWPTAIPEPRVTRYPAVTMDIFPTIAEIAQLTESALLRPLDGESLTPLFSSEVKERAKPILFRYMGGTALIDNHYKLVSRLLGKTQFGDFELYDLNFDPGETSDIASKQPEVFQRLRAGLEEWENSVESSMARKDYAEGRPDPRAKAKPRGWTSIPEYEPHLEQLLKRPEYRRTAEKLQQRVQ